MAEATDPAYLPTTQPIQTTPFCSLSALGRPHLILKLAQLLFSFVAFMCEEFIQQCEVCSGLYFFEFVSCSAFLLTIIILIVYLSKIREKINMISFKKIDFCIVVGTGVLFLIASITFIATIEKTELANASVAFGFLASFSFLAELYFMWTADYLQRREKQKAAPAANGVHEVQPLNRPIQENTAA